MVHSDFPISTDGILGREYLRQEKVEVSFWHNTILTHSYPTKPIPFIDNESRVALDNTTHYKGPMLGPIQVKARTRRVMPIAAINLEVKEGYLPLIKTTEDVLIGEAAVTNLNEICHVFAINTTDNDLEIELPPQKIIPFESYKLAGEDFDKDSADEDYSPPANEAEEVIKNLRLDHLNAEEKEHVLEIVTEFPDNFSYQESL